MNTPRAVLFDLGNVLIHYHPEEFWKVLGITDRKERESYQRQLPSIFIPFEKGEYGLDTCLKRLHNVFNGKYTSSILREAIASVLTTPIAGMEELVGTLSGKLIVALVSNTNEFHYAYCQRVVPALRYLHPHFLSFRMGFMKPERAFYEHVVRELSINPAEVLFIDDVAENVEAARRFGMRGIEFHSPELLQVELGRL
jgi:HAD superfamily hydrolase (TIGR01509 family)